MAFLWILRHSPFVDGFAGRVPTDKPVTASVAEDTPGEECVRPDDSTDNTYHYMVSDAQP